METAGAIDEPAPGASPGTLGAVLYPRGAQQLVREEEWAALVRSAAAGDQAALHGLYERARRPVFTLAVRITGSRETAEEVTLDVFLDVWRRAWSYDPANGTVLGWIMNQARSRAIDRVRYETRVKRVDPRADVPEEADDALDPCELLEIKQRGSTVRAALDALTPDERSAIESAFFVGRTHSEVAEQLKVQERLARRLAELSRRAPADPPPPTWREPDWEEVSPGIFCKLLANDTERHRVSMLVRLLPNVEYPPHTHAGLEELHLLDGELWIDDRKLQPGDYNRAEAPTADKRVWSETGCTCVLITSTRDILA